MKKIFLIFTLFLSISAFAIETRTNVLAKDLPDSTIINQIVGLPLQTYIGKPIDSLFNALPLGFTSRGFMVARAGYAKGLYQSYWTSADNYCSVEIYIDTFNFLSFPMQTPTTSWSMVLAKQEIISYIRVVKNNNQCVFGCGNLNYFYISG